MPGSQIPCFMSLWVWQLAAARRTTTLMAAEFRHRLVWIKIAICMASWESLILRTSNSCSTHAGSSILPVWLFQCKREQPCLRGKEENSISVHSMSEDTSFLRAWRKMPSITAFLIQPNPLHEDKAQKYCWVFLYASHHANSLSKSHLCVQ